MVPAVSEVGVDESTLAAVRGVLAGAPTARAALAAVLDRAEAEGALPAHLSVAVDGPGAAALRQLLGARAVTAVTAGRVRVALDRVPGPFADLLYAVLDRAPRDPAADRARLATELERALATIPPPASATAAAYLAAARGDPDVRAAAAERGVATTAHRIAQIARALDGLAALTEPVRRANFAARVLGDAKALAPGSDLARDLGLALVAHDVGVQAELAAARPRSTTAAAAAALEARGLVRDLASVLVHAWGPLTYAVGDVTFRHVADAARLGVATPLSLAQLRGARVVDLPIERITIFENQAPFLDYLEQVAPPRELVVCAHGQATWAVVRLLRLCAGARVAIRHAGDLDRAGILILRSLVARVRAPIAPWHMDASTHARFAARGRPLDPAERMRVARLVATDDPAAPAHDLLLAIHATGLWVEQEAISHALWIPPPHRDPFSTAG